MLSTKVIGNAGHAQHYFLGQDNYYTENDALGQEQSSWWGKGAKSLKLEGQVDPEAFTRLLEGKIPSGERLGVMVNGDLKHRPGFDLTFSAPKSVSILALIGGDERILKAVERATDKALSLIEQDQAKARITRNGITESVKTSNLVVAKFQHDLSREGDPQLHTHCVVMNMTQRPDGQWRSLASQLGNYKENVQKIPEGFIEGVRHHKKYYGAIFRAELAYEITQLGYTVEKTSAHGFFEISGVSQATLKAFSERREDITVYMQEKGLSGAKAAAVATLQTRQGKEGIDRQNLHNLWQAKSDAMHLDAFQEAKQVVDAAITPVKVKTIVSADHVLGEKVVQDAILHLAETSISLRENAILHHAMQNAVGKNISVDTILHALEEAKRVGRLIPLPMENPRSEMQFTTATLLRYEQELLRAVSLSHASSHPMLPKSQINALVAKQTMLSASQTTALHTIFSSEKRIMALTGSACSGKSYLIAPIIELGEKSGYRPILLTPGKMDIIHLQQALRSQPKNLQGWIAQIFDQKQFATVSGFLHQKENKPPENLFLQKKPLLVVDNANQLSSCQLYGLLQYVEYCKGRLIVIGDSQSTLSWQAGNPFTQMLAQGVVEAELSGNQRVTDSSLKLAVSNSLRGNIQTAFSHIEHRIISLEDKSQRLDLMAAHYVGIDSDLRKNTYVLMPTKSAAEEMNLIIHDRCKELGEIRDEIAITTLQPHFQSAIESQYTKNYAVGQWVRFHGDYLSLGVSQGDYRQICGIDTKHNMVLLRQSNQKIKRWNPERIAQGKVEVFDEKERSVGIGEQLVWRSHNKKTGLQVGDRLLVSHIEKNQLILIRENGKSLALNLQRMDCRHFDYGYSTTPLQKPAKTPDTIIAYQNAFSRQSHQRSFYQLISQAKNQAWIYTESKDQLLQTLQKHTGDKTTVIDMLIPNKALEQKTKDSTYSLLIEKTVEKALRQIQKTSNPQVIAQNAVHYALAHLSEREAAFRHTDVMQVALQYALGKTNQNKIQVAIQQAEKQGDLVAGIFSHNGQHWTTKEALQLEREIINLARQDQNAMPQLAHSESIQAQLSKTTLSAEHTDILQKLLVQKNRIILLQGFAGTGKTTLLQQVQTVLQNEDKTLLCLAPTHQAVKELKSRGLGGQTLDQFIKDHGNGKKINDRHVVALDESSMVSNKKLYNFLSIIKSQNARSIVIGDTRQYSAIESGKPFALLQQAGFPTLHLTEITRQKNEALRQAVKETYGHNFKKAFEILEKNIVEIGGRTIRDEHIDNRLQRLESIRDDYLSRSSERRAQTLVITFGNEERVQLNNVIRAGLKQQGELKGQGIAASVLVPCSMTAAEKTVASNYKIGDVVRFGGVDNAIGIEKGQCWSVRVIRSEQNLLILEKGEASILWKPSNLTQNRSHDSTYFEVYKPEKREVLEGDLIRWTRTDNNLGLISPELARVEKVQNDALVVQPIKIAGNGLIASGSSFNIKPNDSKFQHWDYAYVMTGYSAQGKTVSDVIINAETNRPLLTNQASFLVGITRAVNNLTIYTNDKQAFVRLIENNPGHKTSALEVVHGLAADDKNIKSGIKNIKQNLRSYAKENELTL